jgi:hypothetical protein
MLVFQGDENFGLVLDSITRAHFYDLYGAHCYGEAA